jgi:uncharacterized protein YjbI with pentapeptide repeats
MTVTIYKLNGTVIGTGPSARVVCEAHKANLGSADLRYTDLSDSDLSNARGR